VVPENEVQSLYVDIAAPIQADVQLFSKTSPYERRRKLVKTNKQTNLRNENKKCSSSYKFGHVSPDMRCTTGVSSSKAEHFSHY